MHEKCLATGSKYDNYLFFYYIYPRAFVKKAMGIFLTPPSVRPTDDRPSIRPSDRPCVRYYVHSALVCLIFDTQGYFVCNETQKYTSVKPSIRLSVTLSPPKPLGGIQPNFLHHGKGVREQHFFPVRPSSVHLSVHLIFCVSFRPCVPRPSICLSHYLFLNHWAEFYKTCYIISPHGKGVRG